MKALRRGSARSRLPLAMVLLLILAPFPARATGGDHVAISPSGNGLAVHDYKLPVDVDRSLFVSCSGSGSPAVVLVGGYGGGVGDWTEVQPEIATQTLVCSYDRAGTGSSDPPESVPVGAHEVTADLSAVIDSVAGDEPIVLVGFSIGGMLATLYSALNPTRVDALVLVDSTHPLWPAIQLAEVSGQNRSQLLDRFSGLDPTEPEQLDILAIGKEVLASPGPVAPILILSAGIKSNKPDAAGDRIARILTRLENEIIADTGATRIVAQGCPHELPMKCPDFVVNAIVATVETIRSSAQDDIPG